MYNYMTSEGFPRSLRTYKAHQYRVLCKDDASDINAALNNVLPILMPQSVALSTGGDQSTSERLVCAPRDEDQKTHRDLFKKCDYVLMAPGYTMLGTYRRGEEARLVSDYLSRFLLKA